MHQADAPGTPKMHQAGKSRNCIKLCVIRHRKPSGLIQGKAQEIWAFSHFRAQLGQLFEVNLYTSLGVHAPELRGIAQLLRFRAQVRNRAWVHQDNLA